MCKRVATTLPMHEAAKFGWKFDTQPQRHYCPECSKEMLNPRPEKIAGYKSEPWRSGI
jgi:hypothetical protein